MPSELELQIQQHVMRYLAGEEPLSQFEDWFVPTLWDIDEQDERTRDHAGTIHILISELSRGDRSLQDFHNKLAETIRVSDENRYGDPSSRAESTSGVTRVAA